jgi:hypothetical protein
MSMTVASLFPSLLARIARKDFPSVSPIALFGTARKSTRPTAAVDFGFGPVKNSLHAIERAARA